MERAKKLSRIVSLHEEDPQYIGKALAEKYRGGAFPATCCEQAGNNSGNASQFTARPLIVDAAENFSQSKKAVSADTGEKNAHCFRENLIPTCGKDVSAEPGETLDSCSFKNLIPTHGINAGSFAERMGYIGADRKAEWSMVQRDLKIALETGCAVDIQHVSAKETVSLLREALQKENDCYTRRIHGEATPHHFSLCEEDVARYGTLAKMNPPLRTREDREAIIAGLKDNTLDIIATDHAPHTMAEKARPFQEAPSGITGLETAFALGITNLVRPGHLPLLDFLAKLTINPARAYGLDAGYLAEGGPADIVLFDPEEKHKVASFLSKGSNSPFFGWSLYGTVKMTICGGELVYRQ
ncbi:MAG: amidohydrolase family protein [Lachnospiraceae bacterium]|nr:amidohydrolase family protein [Lachnospiraceae bacterium]